MSTLEELDDLDRREKDDRKRVDKDKKETSGGDGDAEMKEADQDEDILDDEVLGLSTQDILTRKRLLENDSRIMKSELSRLSHEKAAMGEKIKENVDKIANNRYGLANPPFHIWCPQLNGATDNCHTLSETSSSFWIWIPRPNLRKKGQISISMPPEWASPRSSKPRRDRQYFCL